MKPGIFCPRCGAKSLGLRYSMPVDVEVRDGIMAEAIVHHDVLEYENEAFCGRCGRIRLWWSERSDMAGEGPTGCRD